MTTTDPWTPRPRPETAATPPDGASAGPARGLPTAPLARAALACSAVGLVLLVAAFVIPLANGGHGITWVYVGGIVLLPLGFLLAIAHALRQDRHRRR